MINQLTILIADDSREQAEVLSKLMSLRFKDKLTDVEIKFEIVGNLSDAFRVAQSANVTILDLDLPDSETTDTIKSIGQFRPPVIILTANDDPEVTARCIAAGADHVFVKGQIHGLCARVLESIMRDILHNHAPKSN